MVSIAKRSSLIFVALLACVFTLAAQHHIVEGFVYEKNSNKPLTEVEISVVGNPSLVVTSTDSEGHYLLSNLPSGKFTLQYVVEGYKAGILRIDLPANTQRSQLKPVYLELEAQNGLEEDLDDNFAAFIVEDIGEEVATTGQSPTLLTASRDPYTNKAGFQFSPIRFRIRGYDSPYQDQLLNGFAMNNMTNGYSAWSLWNGLNNATINQESTEGLGTAAFSFGNIGGAVNISTRPSLFGKGGRVTYSNSNRSYNHRAMFFYSTGVLESGWALTLSASTRQGNHGYALGQFYDAYGYYLGVEKDFRNGHSLMLTTLAAPTERGVASAATQEVYDLVGSNFYNPNVGMLNGRWRNARVRNSHEPVLQLQHEYKHPGFTITSGVGYRFGYNAYSALNWHNAPDPRPDYYRYLPSYFGYMTENSDPFAEAYNAERWRSERNVRYINWERLYDINDNNYQRVYDKDGNLLAEGRRSEYVLEDRHTDQRQWNASTVANIKLDERFKLDLGANYRYNRTRNFNVLKDLLGGDFWYDIDKFSERDFPDDPDKAQLDLNNPDRIVKEGDVYSHNYISQIQNAEVWGNFSWSSIYLDGYAALMGSWTNMHRDGKQRRGLFPENSFGKSDMLNFFNYGVKAGINVKLSGHHFILANAAFISKAPYFQNIFISPRTNNSYVQNPQSELIASGDISYVLRTPFIKGRVTLFYSKFLQGTKKMSFYDDAYRAFSNYILTNIERQHMGIEVGFEAKLSPALTATAVFTMANYTYANNPDYIQTVDNNQQLLEQDRVYWRGFHVAGTPQTAANLSFNYQTPFYMYMGIDFNYFSRGFIDINPKRRTDKAREELDYSFVKQERFPAAFTVDANLGYSWRIKNGTFLRFNFSVTNILNNKNVKSGGYEQLRIRQTSDGKMMRPFDSRYYYMIGTNYYFNIVLVF